MFSAMEQSAEVCRSGAMSDKPFVFIIGFNKCGTRTLHQFFKKNGFPCVHGGSRPLAIHMVMNCIQDRQVFFGYDKKFRVFSDLTFLNNRICIEGNSFFRNMDRDYPGSFFIYNTRDVQKWIASRLRHFGLSGSFLERYCKVLNTSDQKEVVAGWIEGRARFERDLSDYFGGSERLLILDIESDQPARLISSFLGMDLDESAWSWTGKTPDRETPSIGS